MIERQSKKLRLDIEKDKNMSKTPQDRIKEREI